MMRLHKLNA